MAINLTTTISIGDIIKTVMVVAAGFTYGVTVETRFEQTNGQIANQAFQIMVLEKRMDRTDKRVEDTVKEIKEALIRIENKIDKR